MSVISWASGPTTGRRRNQPTHAQPRCTCSMARATAATPLSTQPSAASYLARHSTCGCAAASARVSPTGARRPIWSRTTAQMPQSPSKNNTAGTPR